MALPAKPATANPLQRHDTSTGLSLVQTIYGIAMVLGVQGAIETAYAVLVAPSPQPTSMPRGVLFLMVAAIMLLGLRFFWVPRNLYAYLLVSKHPLERRLRRMTLLHFPIVLIHALLFYCVCQAFVDVASSTAPLHSSLSRELATRFVFFYAGLLLVNGAWLLLGFGNPGRSTAEWIWGWNNLAAAVLTVAAWIAFEALDMPVVAFLSIAATIFAANSLIDLWKASAHYILFPKRIPDGESP
jgi:hypothetical protein